MSLARCFVRLSLAATLALPFAAVAQSVFDEDGSVDEVLPDDGSDVREAEPPDEPAPAVAPAAATKPPALTITPHVTVSGGQAPRAGAAASGGGEAQRSASADWITLVAGGTAGASAKEEADEPAEFETDTDAAAQGADEGSGAISPAASATAAGKTFDADAMPMAAPIPATPPSGANATTGGSTADAEGSAATAIAADGASAAMTAPASTTADGKTFDADAMPMAAPLPATPPSGANATTGGGTADAEGSAATATAADDASSTQTAPASTTAEGKTTDGANSAMTAPLAATATATSAGKTAVAEAPPMPPSALFSTWMATLPAEAAQSYFTDPKLSVMVVGAGDVDALPAARALVSALRASARVRLVMDQGALGDAKGMSDPELLERIQPLPVDELAVVRVYAADRGAREIAVVTVYRKGGSVRVAFDAERGTPLGKRAELAFAAPEEPSAAAPAETVTPAPAVEANGVWGPPRDPAGEYDHRYITIDPGTRDAHQGVQRRNLEPEQFYSLVGREDLAFAYRWNMARKVGLIVSGVAAMAVSGIAIADNLIASSPYTKNRQGDDPAQGVSALLLASGGAIGVLIGLAIDANPVSADAVQSMAQGFNNRLRDDLGLKDDLGLSSRRGRSARRRPVSVGVQPLPGGAAISVQGAL